MSVFTYLLQSQIDQSYYVGISEDPTRRLREHNSGKLASSARKKPYVLQYIKEHNTYDEARKHEKWLKKKNRAYKEKLILPT